MKKRTETERALRMRVFLSMIKVHPRAVHGCVSAKRQIHIFFSHPHTMMQQQRHLPSAKKSFKSASLFIAGKQQPNCLVLN
jgi:hypothetical protein